MKTIICFFLLTVLTLAGAHARLGETIEQCVQRYGRDYHLQSKTTGKTAEPGSKRLPTDPMFKEGRAIGSFIKDGIQINIGFWNGIAISISYTKYGIPRNALNAFSEKEVTELAELNKEDSSWEKKVVGKIIQLKRLDGKVGGSYMGANIVSFSPVRDASFRQNANTSGL